MRLSAPYGATRDIEYAWPEILAPADPWSGDEALPDPACYASYRRHGGKLSQAEFQDWDQRFLAAYQDILSGRAGWAAGSIVRSHRSCGIANRERRN